MTYQKWNIYATSFMLCTIFIADATTTQSTEQTTSNSFSATTTTTRGHLAQYSGHDAVAGGVTGGVIFLIAIGIAVVVLVLWRKRKLSRYE